MSKKKFKDGLDSLFADQEEVAAGADDQQSEKPRRRRRSKPPKASSKSFSHRFDELFQHTLFERVYDTVEKVTKESAAQVPEEKSGGRGLDSLIRGTLKKTKVEVPVPKDQKRVTFTFDQELLGKLRSIARMEKAYLKDLIADAVEEFIHEYEEAHGDLD